MKGALLGPAFSDDEVRTFLDAKAAGYRRYPTTSRTARSASRRAGGRARSSAGFRDAWNLARARSGARSILGDPRNPRCSRSMNLKIKFRESFRPFAPVRAASRTSRDISTSIANRPTCCSSHRVRKDKRLQLTDEQRAVMHDPDLRKRVNVARTTLPAITHVDYSARIQTVDEARNGRYYG